MLYGVLHICLNLVSFFVVEKFKILLRDAVETSDATSHDEELSIIIKHRHLGVCWQRRNFVPMGKRDDKRRRVLINRLCARSSFSLLNRVLLPSPFQKNSKTFVKTLAKISIRHRDLIHQARFFSNVIADY